MSAMSHASFDAGVLLGYAVENGDQWRCFCGDMHMQKLKDMDGRQGELPALVEGQQWKLWLARAILAAACASFLMPGCIGRMLDVPGVAVQLGAMVLCFISLEWAAYAVRCRHCGLRIVMYEMSRQSIGQWLHRLLSVKRCPKCGADHAGRP